MSIGEKRKFLNSLNKISALFLSFSVFFFSKYQILFSALLEVMQMKALKVKPAVSYS